MFEKLLKTLDEKQITRYRLAKLAGITPQDLYAMLAGRRPLFPSWKERICSVLEMPADELFPELKEGGEHEEG